MSAPASSARALPRIAIAQIAMHWTTAQNVASMRQAMDLAHSRGARLCAFSELAVTGFHRLIAREARTEVVCPAVRELQAHAAQLSLGIAAGAPSFGADGAIYNSHLLIDERGANSAHIAKHGLTTAEATFFQRGASRPIGMMHGLRCSAVICREVEDIDLVSAALPPGSVDLVFVPGALRQDPEKPRTDPPAFVHDILRLAAATKAYVVQTNWPNALNRPEESVEGGGSVVAGPDGALLLRLPAQVPGIGVFTLGERQFEWHPQ
jgi:omega-amidase